MARRADESDGFDEFVRATWPRLRQAAFALTGQREDAEDLLQTVLARTFSRWSKVSLDDPVVYARRALVNAYIDGWRKRRRHGDVLVPEVRESYDPPDRLADRDDLETKLRSLSDRERSMVVLRHYFDLSEAAVADELGCSLGTVKSTTSRALQKLRTHSNQEA